MTMKNLRTARKRARLSQAEVAQAIGLSQSQYSNWERGFSKIDNVQLLRLSNLLDVSVEYLINDSITNPRSKQSDGVRIPVLGHVAAGIPIEAIEEIVDWEEIPESLARTGDFFGLQIKGNSMKPRILQGDTVIVRRQDDVSSGDTAIVLVNGDEGTCKKILKHEGGGLSLISLNTSACPPQFFTPQEVRSLPVVIIGKVVELRGKL